MVKHSRKLRKPDADLDLEIDEYEPSDSDDDYDENEKTLLQKAAKKNVKFDEDEDESEEEIYRIHSSDDEEEEGDEMEPVGEDMDSDIEGKGEDENDGLPSSKAWGSKRKTFYHTDYVDQDYGGFSKAEEEEAALLEEQEARTIQNRLVAELEDVDLSFGLLTKVENKDEKTSAIRTEDVDEIIKTDLSKLSKREKMELLKKESPEFLGLVSDFKERLTYAQDKLEPIIRMIKSKEISESSAVKFIETKFQLTLNYCTNISFYLLLKAKHINIQSHPIVKRLFWYRKLLEQLDAVGECVEPQIDAILENREEEEQVQLVAKRPHKRKKLNLLTLKEREIEVDVPKKKSKSEVDIEETVNDDIAEDEDGIDEENNEEPVEDTVEKLDGKRAITFQIAKNKGLTPRRKKEQRNPRVKHRNKYKKAKIRRKGQVREVRKEVTRYDGEMSGIKASVVKSVKLK